MNIIYQDHGSCISLDSSTSYLNEDKSNSRVEMRMKSEFGFITIFMSAIIFISTQQTTKLPPQHMFEPPSDNRWRRIKFRDWNTCWGVNSVDWCGVIIKTTSKDNQFNLHLKKIIKNIKVGLIERPLLLLQLLPYKPTTRFSIIIKTRKI